MDNKEIVSDWLWTTFDLATPHMLQAGPEMKEQIKPELSEDNLSLPAVTVSRIVQGIALCAGVNLHGLSLSTLQNIAEIEAESMWICLTREGMDDEDADET